MHLRRRSIVAAATLIVVAAASAVAASLNELHRTVETARTVLGADIRMEKLMEDSEQREAKGELFHSIGVPASAATSDQSGAGEQFISFKEGGVTVVLKDVLRQQWFAPYVRDMVSQRILSGYRDDAGKPLGEFRPSNDVSVEELAKMAVLAAFINPSACPQTAKNASALDRWSEQFVACAESFGWAVYADGTIDVTRPATRSEVVMTLLQAYGVSVDGSSDGKTFKDVNGSTLFAGAIERAVRDGIVSGYADKSGKATGTFGPEDSINRAEIAKMLSLSVQVYR